MKQILTKKARGVTLIALVITVVVLLILAGITINSLTNEKGIIKEAKTAKKDTEKAAVEEQIELAIIKAEQKYRNPTIENIIEELINSKVITNDSQVDKTTGTITTDLGYVIEVSELKEEEPIDESKVYLDPAKWTYKIDNSTNTATLLKYSGRDSRVIVPNYIKTENGDVPIKGIENYIWDESICDTDGEYNMYPSFVTSVIVSEGIESLGTFVSTENLASITIPGTVKQIGYMTFACCYSLSTVTLGEGVEKIMDMAFYRCTALTRIVIPNTTTQISDGAFRGSPTKLVDSNGNPIN